MLIFSELAVRGVLPELNRRAPVYYNRQYLHALTRPDPVLLWAGRPRAQAEIANSAGEKITYRLNSLGWRDREFNPLEMAGNALVLGDSFTFGTGVSEGKRYADLLENAFHGLDVWDLGVMGYAPDQYLLLAGRWLPPVPWRFLIVHLSNNEVGDAARHEWIDVDPLNGIPRALAFPLSRRLLNSPSEAWNLLALRAASSRPADSWLDDGLRRLLFSMRELAKLANERRVPMIVAQATDWGEPAYGARIAHAYRDGMIALAREQNFSLLEVGQLPLLPRPDYHWTEAAHYRVAEMLVPAVREIVIPGDGHDGKQKQRRKR